MWYTYPKVKINNKTEPKEGASCYINAINWNYSVKWSYSNLNSANNIKYQGTAKNNIAENQGSSKMVKLTANS